MNPDIKKFLIQAPLSLQDCLHSSIHSLKIHLLVAYSVFELLRIQHSDKICALLDLIFTYANIMNSLRPFVEEEIKLNAYICINKINIYMQYIHISATVNCSILVRMTKEDLSK